MTLTNLSGLAQDFEEYLIHSLILQEKWCLCGNCSCYRETVNWIIENKPPILFKSKKGCRGYCWQARRQVICKEKILDSGAVSTDHLPLFKKENWTEICFYCKINFSLSVSCQCSFYRTENSSFPMSPNDRFEWVKPKAPQVTEENSNFSFTLDL